MNSPPSDAVAGSPSIQHDSFHQGRVVRRVAIGLSLAFAAWLLLPLAGMVHVEGFSASIDSLALHAVNRSLLDYDRQFPFNLDYFVATRSGVVAVLAALHRFVPGPGEWAFRVVMLAGFAGLVVASVVLVRRWTGLGGAWILAALLLMPGVSESAFFYNDNVISSGLSIVALAVLATGSTDRVALRAGLAGLAFGAAIACRSDALLVAPALAGTLWIRQGGSRDARVALVAGLASAAVGVLLAFVAVYAAYGLTIVDSLAAARRAVLLWSRGPSLKTHALTLVFFVGIPAGLLALLGCFALLRSRRGALAATVVGTLLIYNVVYLGKAWEVRSFLPMTPFFATLVCFGALWLLRHATRLQLGALVALLIVVWFAPPLRIATHDGPREVVGRAWAPVLWTTWQRERRADSDGFDRFVAGIDASTLVVTSNWNADRYLHLALQQAGYAPVAPTSSECGRVVETVARGDVVVRHLRLHVPFVAIYPAYVPLRYDTFVDRCGGPPPSRIFYAASLATLREAGLADRAVAFSVEKPTTLPFLPNVTTEPDGVVALDATMLADLRRSWAADASKSVATSGTVLPAWLPPSSRTVDESFAPTLHRLHAR